MGFFAKIFGKNDDANLWKEEKKSLFDDSEKNLSNESKYSVKLIDSGRSKIGVIKLIIENSGVGLKEAKGICDNNGVIIENISHEDAIKIQKIFKKNGASVEII